MSLENVINQMFNGVIDARMTRAGISGAQSS
jgi:hypothetical protein